MRYDKPCDEAYPECPYCKEELLNHKPSRCLDAWVATVCRVETSWRGFGIEHGMTISSMHTFSTAEAALADFVKDKTFQENMACFAVPEQYYSSDLTDAMALLKEMNDRYKAKSVLTILPEYAVLNFTFNPHQAYSAPPIEHECGGPDICMAICRAMIIASRSIC